MSKLEAKILIVDDDQDVLLAAKLFLKQHFDIVHTEKNPENLPGLLANENYDVILLDMNFSKDATSGKEGFHWLNVILETDPAAVVIFITGYGDIELAVQGIKEGATNFLLKPWENKKVARHHHGQPESTGVEEGTGGFKNQAESINCRF